MRLGTLEPDCIVLPPPPPGQNGGCARGTMYPRTSTDSAGARLCCKCGFGMVPTAVNEPGHGGDECMLAPWVLPTGGVALVLTVVGLFLALKGRR